MSKSFASVFDCAGDCAGDQRVTVEELVRGVNISLGMAAIQPCAAFDLNGDERVTVDELEVKGNNDALSGFRDSRDPQPVARPRLRSHPDWQALGPQPWKRW